jgi:hypothetical protein
MFILSCNRTSKEITKNKLDENKPSTALKQSTKPTKKASSENFDKFYLRFHSDSLFQMQRVKFPMQGYTIDSTGKQLAWTKQNWLIHRMGIQEVDTSIYKTSVKKDPGLYEENIFIEGGGFRVKRLFKQEKGKWYLILFEDEEF